MEVPYRYGSETRKYLPDFIVLVDDGHGADEPWGARLEIMLRELDGVIWIQIASAIVLLRLIIGVPFHLWRLRKERRVRY